MEYKFDKSELLTDDFKNVIERITMNTITLHLKKLILEYGEVCGSEDYVDITVKISDEDLDNLSTLEGETVDFYYTIKKKGK